jgi:IS605 OrfB family transposase
MKRTISIRLETTQDQNKQLVQLQDAYQWVCNQIVSDVIANRCWNRVALHRLVYTKLSKYIVQEAIEQKAQIIVLEDLTKIRKRIKAGKRMRTRLHRWAFRHMQMFIQYKAEAKGLSVMYVNPAYSSQTCSICDAIGVRERHLFKCSCGNQQHADWNASQNHCRFALGTLNATCVVNRTQVAV